MTKLALLGSTGSIGTATLDVVRRHRDRVSVVAIAGYRNVERLAEQAREFQPMFVAIADESKRRTLKDALGSLPCRVLAGEAELVAMATSAETTVVVNSIVGAAGLRASLAALQAGKRLALANKESLVIGGPLFPSLIQKFGGTILPIDSEHSAIWQAMNAGRKTEVRRIILTASGGPFRTLEKAYFPTITPAMALAHPTWVMGKKITIDSATLVNKGLEIIEATVLFDLPASVIDVVVHPQSIVHSMVEFVDSSIVAQLSNPDMRLPIQYALFWPERIENTHGAMSFSDPLSLSFEPPDHDRFPALRLAIEVATNGGVLPAAFNAANEVAVEKFLAGQISFPRISEIIAEVVVRQERCSAPTLEDILHVDAHARRVAHSLTGESVPC